jgi:golgi pH regulator
LAGKTDPVSGFFQLLATYFGVNIDLEYWLQDISFAFVGLIILTSIRTFLMSLMKVGRSPYNLPTIIGVSNISIPLFFLIQLFQIFSANVALPTMTLLLAQIMGMYFLSSVLLVRVNLPQEYRQVEKYLAIQPDFHFNPDT